MQMGTPTSPSSPKMTDFADPKLADPDQSILAERSDENESSIETTMTNVESKSLQDKESPNNESERNVDKDAPQEGLTSNILDFDDEEEEVLFVNPKNLCNNTGGVDEDIVDEKVKKELEADRKEQVKWLGAKWKEIAKKKNEITEKQHRAERLSAPVTHDITALRRKIDVIQRDINGLQKSRSMTESEMNEVIAIKANLDERIRVMSEKEKASNVAFEEERLVELRKIEEELRELLK